MMWLSRTDWYNTDTSHYQETMGPAMKLTQSVLLALGNPKLLSAGSYPDCINGPLATNLVCEPTASTAGRAKAVVDKFTVSEMITNTGNTSPGVARLGLPKYEWWNEALHGVAEGHGVKFQPAGQSFSSATSFPVPLNLGAAFNDSLARQVASITSTEARAFNNFGFAGLVYWTPNINPFKDPCWVAASKSTAKIPWSSRATSCRYQAVNGVPACANSYLIQDILRDHWGFNRPDNWIVSDCGALRDIYTRHKYYHRAPAAAAAMSVGVNINCGGVYQANLTSAVNDGLVNETQLRQALYGQYASLINLLRPPRSPTIPLPHLVLRKHPLRPIPRSHRLIPIPRPPQNSNRTLPLNPSVKKIALIGPYANATTQMQGNYFGIAPFLISPLQGPRDAGYDVTFVPGTNISGTSTEGFEAALAAARQADVVIYAGGIDLSIEAEARDRTTLTWPGNQLDLIKFLADAGKPFVLVQFGGGQVDDSWLKSSSKVRTHPFLPLPIPPLLSSPKGQRPPLGRLPRPKRRPRPHLHPQRPHLPSRPSPHHTIDRKSVV